MNADAARAAGQVSIRFADDSVNAVIGEGGPRPRAAKPAPKPGQADLFNENG
jgi:hypothetical protein